MKRKLHHGINLAAVLFLLVSAIPGRVFAQAFGKPLVSINNPQYEGGEYFLSGTANPNGAVGTACLAWIEWGYTTAYGNTSTPMQITGVNNGFYLDFFGSLPNTVYHYRGAASNYLGINYTSDVSFTSVGGPIITSQPQGQIIDISDPLSLSVSATSTPPLTTITYQWLKDGTNIPSANGPSYSVAHAQASDAGVYWVAVENAYFGGWQIFSSQVSINVGPAPVPTFSVVRSNGNLVFSWPVYQPNYQLQSATDLNSTNWASAGGTTVINNNTVTVTLPVPSTQRFFRLSYTYDR